ncbi:hypothetical protein LMG30113_07558 [Burkholderia paludis]|nr:hypothetical protein LMG30113_07558 [Burkholderia paludis]
MTHDVLRLVPEEPFRSPVRMSDAVGVAENVVVVPGLVAMSVGDIGQTNVRIPLQFRVVGAVVSPFTHGLGRRTVAIPAQVHPPAGTVRVPRHQVVLVRVAAARTILVGCRNQIACIVVGIVGELTNRLVVFDQPHLRHATLFVGHHVNVGIDLDLTVIGHQIGWQQRMIGHVLRMIIGQRQALAVAQYDARQTEVLAVTLVGLSDIVATRQGHHAIGNPHQRQVLDGVVMKRPDLRQRIRMGAAIRGVIAKALRQRIVLHDVEPRRVRCDPARTHHPIIIGRKI